ncbi:hypothetical protein PHK61_26725 [Actinomycetospora lutea]|uniref:hypothetical protein n=1 Tax=Actinomycetospora lutea TaxID=663604 RepID=UPI0023669702|nr:hypothetical protein [Actinomycetospora lutea]MDD7942016.1 hypothetical protein [Actinomycetospora lutea]
MPLGAGVAAASPPEPTCAAVVEAKALVRERQSALDEALAAYQRQKTVMSTTRATYERLQADDSATSADVEDARVTAQRAAERNTRLFDAQQAAGRALQEAVRELADAREECENSNEGPEGPQGPRAPEGPRVPEQGPEGPRGPEGPQHQPTTVVNQQVTVNQQTNIHPTSVYLWNGGRWVAYSDGTAVRCGSGGQDVERVEVVNAGLEQGAPSVDDVEDAAYPEGGVAAGDGSGATVPIVPLAAGAVGLTALGAGGVAWHRRRSAP